MIIYLLVVDNFKSPMGQPVYRVTLPIFLAYGIPLGIDVKRVQTLQSWKRVQLSQTNDVRFFEKQVVDVGETMF